MKISIRDLGVLKQADFELGGLTIIGGENNTGKTYATYALYGFLEMWRHLAEFKSPEKAVDELIEQGVTRIDLSAYSRDVPNVIRGTGKQYSELMYRVFASSQKQFEGANFALSVAPGKLEKSPAFRQTISVGKKGEVDFLKEKGGAILEVTSLHEKGETPPPRRVILRLINRVLQDILIAPLLPDTFIASAERTGAVMFWKDLNLARNRLFDILDTLEDRGEKIDSFRLMDKVYDSYAMPVKDNVDFARDLENVAKHESWISEQHPDVLSSFRDIIGGEYKIIRKELKFVPKGSKARLSVGEVSSSVRSLLNLEFYLRHMAEPGDLLIIDEPELNLHPENQRRVARLFARLVNLGIKVFITTHSDYMVKELNTLIMLKGCDSVPRDLMKKFKYTEADLLDANSVRAYVAGKASVKLPGDKRAKRVNTFTRCDIDSQLGIEVKSFDKAIQEMNEIQESILFYEDDA